MTFFVGLLGVLVAWALSNWWFTRHPLHIKHNGFDLYIGRIGTN